MRRRVGTSLAVAAVAAVAVAAIVDAVRPRLGPELDAEAAARLAELGVAGTLVYTDSACELRALSLPGLKSASLPEGRDVGCDISVSPDGERVAAAGARWHPAITAYAICRGERVDVLIPPSGRAQYIYDGCAPAWRPGAEHPGAMTLTVAREGAVLAVEPACEGQPPCEETVVPRGEVERAARAASGAQLPPSDLTVLDLAWSSPAEVVVLAEARYGPLRGTRFVAGFEHGRMTWQRALARRLDRLVVGSRGQLAGEPADLVRAEFRLPGEVAFDGPLDWSPTGLRLVLVSGTSVVVYDPRSGRLVRIPVTARDIAWR
jgi:hypothetical protein